MTTPKVGVSKSVKTEAQPMSPQDLKTLFEALNIAPSFLSKRFIMKYLLGWSDEMVNQNVSLFKEEQDQAKIGNKFLGLK